MVRQLEVILSCMCWIVWHEQWRRVDGISLLVWKERISKACTQKEVWYDDVICINTQVVTTNLSLDVYLIPHIHWYPTKCTHSCLWTLFQEAAWQTLPQYNSILQLQTKINSRFFCCPHHEHALNLGSVRRECLYFSFKHEQDLLFDRNFNRSLRDGRADLGELEHLRSVSRLATFGVWNVERISPTPS